MADERKVEGLRTSKFHVLNDIEIKALKSDIKAINADVSVFKFNFGRSTSYIDELDIITVRGDVLPNLLSKHPRDRLSARAVLAHEYYGHRDYRYTKLAKGAWNDEFRASYMAAKNTPNLTSEERAYLILDAVERAREACVPIKYNMFMRSVLHGYE
jgi:hypothetical protein